MIEIKSTANPDGTHLKHDSGFDPSRKAIFCKGIYCIPVENTFRKPRKLIAEANNIIEMTSQKLRRTGR